MNIYKYIVVVLVSVSINCYSQTAALDIKKMNQFYLNKKNVSLKMTYNFYTNEKAKQPYQSETAVYKRSSNQLLFDVMGVKNLQNEDYKIAVDDDAKVILVGPSDKIDQSLFTSTVIDTLVKYCSDTDYKLLANNVKQYTFNYKNSVHVPYKKSIIELNKDYSISRILFYYNQPIDYGQEDQESLPYLEVKYGSVSTEPIAASYFNMDKYIQTNNNKLIGVGKYAGYQIINHIIQE